MVGSSNFTLLIVIQFHGASAWFLCLLMPLSLAPLQPTPRARITFSLSLVLVLRAALFFSILVPYNFRQTVELETPYRPKIQRGGLDNCLTSSLTILISRQTSFVLDSCTLVENRFGARVSENPLCPVSAPTSRDAELTFQYLIRFTDARQLPSQRCKEDKHPFEIAVPFACIHMYHLPSTCLSRIIRNLSNGIRSLAFRLGNSKSVSKEQTESAK